MQKYIIKNGPDRLTFVTTLAQGSEFKFELDFADGPKGVTDYSKLQMACSGENPTVAINMLERTSLHSFNFIGEKYMPNSGIKKIKGFYDCDKRSGICETIED